MRTDDIECEGHVSMQKMRERIETWIIKVAMNTEKSARIPEYVTVDALSLIFEDIL